jgi:hypothetical protein
MPAHATAWTQHGFVFRPGVMMPAHATAWTQHGFVVLELWCEHTLLREHNMALFLVLELWCQHTLLLEHNMALFVVLELWCEHTLILEHNMALSSWSYDASTRYCLNTTRNWSYSRIHNTNPLLLEHSVALLVVLESRQAHTLLLEHRGTCAWRAAAPTRGTAHYSHSNSSCAG